MTSKPIEFPENRDALLKKAFDAPDGCISAGQPDPTPDVLVEVLLTNSGKHDTPEARAVRVLLTDHAEQAATIERQKADAQVLLNSVRDALSEDNAYLRKHLEKLFPRGKPPYTTPWLDELIEGKADANARIAALEQENESLKRALDQEYQS